LLVTRKLIGTATRLLTRRPDFIPGRNFHFNTPVTAAALRGTRAVRTAGAQPGSAKSNWPGSGTAGERFPSQTISGWFPSIEG